MRNYLLLLIIGLLALSCNETPTTAPVSAAAAPVDSLISNWCKTWSSNDSAGVSSMFTPTALVIDDQYIFNGKATIDSGWIHRNLPFVKNMTAQKLQEWSSGDHAGYVGTYQFDLTIKDTVRSQQKGAFTVNWIREEKGDWKVVSATIHSF